MQYKRICSIIKEKGLSPIISKNKIEFKISNTVFKIIYEVIGEKSYYFIYNNANIPSETYKSYQELKELLNIKL